MYNGKTVCVILPAYNEEESIQAAIDDFDSLEVVDGIIVVDNNSTDKTAEIIKSNEYRKENGVLTLYVSEKNQGYGWALWRGLNVANYDYVVTCEPDGTFTAKDLYKLLAYGDENDAVFGSRTYKFMIRPGANMGPFLYYGNKFVAWLLWMKVVVFYGYNGPLFTDVGCTFKIVKGDFLKRILLDLKVRDSSFSPDFMISCLKHSKKVLEIPVWYGKREGTSKITGTFWKAFKLGLRMIWLILKR